MNTDKKLLLVYNADSSIFAQVGDLIHKTISPKTYQCNLCGLTYSGASMQNEWKDFINSLPINSEFFHKDEFTKTYPQFSNIQLPSVFIKSNHGLTPLITASEIDQQKTLDELKSLVHTKTATL